ncbi:hypothetical protein B0H17DRAFT_1126035 [Mycena rosella]|uniref:YMC020W-like alpha/beta hydrolase domain-containing protein n=1 Tax=Mycena rosella TaxID=1033263 RepID=A0AAD7GVY5_MYCRO|nr:hypothetical protein B0H17DRAFT_1126035 [Mycena rosella]
MSALDTTSEGSPHKPARGSRHPSTASIRSTASTRSPPPSVWRPPNSLRIRKDSLSSATVDPRISCVLAGAEISGTHGNARDKMEALNLGPVAGPSGSSPAASSTSDLPHEIDVISEVEADAPDVPALDTLDIMENPESNLVAFPVSVSPPPVRSSTWFGSLSRAKGKEKLAEVQAAATASAPNLLAPASSSIPIPVPDPEPSASEPVTSSSPLAPELPDPFLANAQAIAAHKASAAKRSWFSSSPVQPSPLRTASPPQAIPNPIRIPSTPEDESGVPSSIDSSVPSPVATPPADGNVSFPLSVDGHETVKPRQRLASLNPSMGRFGLNLPLLGGRGSQSAIDAEASSTLDATTMTATYTSETSEMVVKDSTLSSVSKTDTWQVTTTAAAVSTNAPTTTTRPSDVNTEVRMAQQSSWWDYVSWSALPPAPQSSSQDTTEDEDEGDATPKPIQHPVLAASDGTLPDSTESASSDDDNTKTLSPGAAPAISVSHEQQASWYSPWAWYGSTSSSVMTSAATSPPEDSSEEKPNQTEAPEPETAPADVPPSPIAEPAATAAQQRYWTSFFSYSQPSASTLTRTSEPSGTVEQAHPDTTPAPSPSPDTTAASRKHPTLSLDSNPIEDSINANRTGWVSFFSNSGTLGYVARKTITSGEPEVMEIDTDDEGDTAQVAAAPAPQAAASETVDKTKKAADGKQSKEHEQPRANGTTPSTKPAKPAAPPLTISDSVKRQVVNNNSNAPVKRAPSPAPSVASKQSVVSTGTKSPKPGSIAPPRTPTPNLVLPTWGDTFHAPPRSVLPQRLIDAHGKTVGRAVMEKTMKFVSGVLFAADSTATKRSGSAKGKGRDREDRERDKKYEEWGLGLPRAWDILKPAAGKGRASDESKEGNLEDVLRGCKHVVVIGIHGWFPGAIMRSVLGEPTGTSTKFANMMVEALEQFQASYNVTIDKITNIPLDGEGTIDRRVEKLYSALTSNAEWMADLHAADVIFVATHSQGSIVSTHLLDRLIRDGHIRTGGPDVSKAPGSPGAAPSTPGAASLPAPPPQRVCCLALCGIHLGPLRYLSSSSLVLPYIQYFESAAAKELFEFQNTESEVSKAYVKALCNVVDNGTKMVYVASLNDQVVPIYSGLFTAASHPLILRALYIDGDAYHSSDFLSNLLVLLIRVLNSGLSDSGLIAHLSEATAGSLNGLGHSTVYEELSTYSLAVKYLFLSNSGFDTHPKLTVEPFNANTEQNDYEIPWSLRDLIADERVAHFLSKEIFQLAADFRRWHPKTTILREIKRKLQPIQRLPPSFATTTNSTGTSPASVSKL